MPADLPWSTVCADEKALTEIARGGPPPPHPKLPSAATAIKTTCVPPRCGRFLEFITHLPLRPRTSRSHTIRAASLPERANLSVTATGADFSCHCGYDDRNVRAVWQCQRLLNEAHFIRVIVNNGRENYCPN